jgi:exopolysaccharide biosynthesis polyprenyl glycosylphosphotransferase
LIFVPINLGKWEFIIFVATSSLLLWGFRYLLHAVMFTYFPSYFDENVLILGLPNSSDVYRSDISHKFGKNLNIIGFINSDKKSYRANRNFLGHIDDLSQIVNDSNIKRLIVTGEFNDLSSAELIERTNELNILCSFITHSPMRSTNHININTLPALSIASWNRLQLMVFNLVKRLMDILIAILLFILNLPFAIIICILIKLDDGGPVLFAQERIGQHGGKFLFFKFRTMNVDTNSYAVSPMSQEDPRITRVGRFIRKLSLDELPQLINVLKGDMSLIGPRPEMPFIVAGYDSITDQRHLVRPGITGIWQISAGRKHAIHNHIEYDFFYIENMSLTLDIIIILVTFRFILKGLTA